MFTLDDVLMIVCHVYYSSVTKSFYRSVLCVLCALCATTTITTIIRLNDVLARVLSSADIPVAKEPAGLLRMDGTRPDGMTLIPWRAGKPVVWDVTVVCTCTDSYVGALACEAGAAAEVAAACKMANYSGLSDQYKFYTVALKTLGPFNETA